MHKPVLDKIYKYPLIKQITQINIPIPARFLSLGKDANGQTCVWFIVNPNNSNTVSCWFYKYGTGWSIDRDLHTDCDFLGTVVEEQDVWHVFMTDERWLKSKEEEKMAEIREQLKDCCVKL